MTGREERDERARQERYAAQRRLELQVLEAADTLDPLDNSDDDE
ncbi:hypothetical protein [Cryptosporangium aurantiacum]|uniref:Uncharacterized protein n=1 Tax=Cryptosporangium aurantiacum TaxID=134849 RepID=A0A1M7RPQ4_9ACTN|nr:hypothetical protein [Cryptosporangium aurantiacum]SHN48209.1 hypothetical protein SAMN05443668_13627 [Cryptosporangium aurantiacum]